MPAPVENLEAALGYRFADREILHRALTHSSWANDHTNSSTRPSDNEQLEFLGDSVLGFIISEALVSRFPSYPEGALSTLKAHLVSAVHLQKVARKLDLGEYLELGRGEEMSGGREKKTLLVNALEAVLAATYLDGGIDAARNVVLEQVIGIRDLTERVPEDLLMTQPNYKSELQELAHAHRLPSPRYTIVREQGPEHSKTFTVEVRIGHETISHAEGISKKSAAQNAARDAIAMLRERYAEPKAEGSAAPTVQSQVE